MSREKKILPLNKRTDGEPKAIEGSFSKSVSCIMPVAVYYFLSLFLTYGAAYLIGTGQYGTRTSKFAADHAVGVASAIRIAVVILSVLPLIPGFIGEKPIIFQKGNKINRRSISFGIYVVLLASSLALFLNVLFSKIGLSSSSQSFSETSAKQMAFPLLLGILIYGIINPLTEEIVYRGLVYNRLRRFYGFPIAIVAAPLLFGLSHGNMVQLIYGFIMGVVICLVYELFGSFAYTCLFHIAANTVVYIVMKYTMLKEAVGSLGGLVFFGALSVALVAICGLTCAGRGGKIWCIFESGKDKKDK